MRVRIGDRVRFLNEVGGGKIVKILDKGKAVVETEDGFEIPVLDADLVVINSAADDRVRALGALPPQKAQPRQELDNSIIATTPDEESEADGEGNSIALLLALVPGNCSAPHRSSTDLYIINDSTYRVFYTVSEWDSGRLLPLKSALLTSDTKELIKTYGPEELNRSITFNVQAVYHKNTAYKAHQPEFYDFELNPVKLHKGSCFTDNDFFDTRACIISVSDSHRELLLKHLTDKAIAEAIRQKGPKPATVKPIPKADSVEEVDLHIHELVDSWSGMTPGEIIQIQLARFDVALQGGLKGGTRKMVFIHGVGNGKLKYEITRMLDSKYPKLRYQDASFKEYGYGATLVYLK